MAEFRSVASSRLIHRLRLTHYYREAPLSLRDFEPDEVVLKLQQHIGAQALPIVQIGETVSKGQLIAEIPENALGARVHASLSGRVTEITENYIRIVKGGEQS